MTQESAGPGQHVAQTPFIFTVGIVCAWYTANIGVVLVNRFMLSATSFRWIDLLLQTAAQGLQSFEIECQLEPTSSPATGIPFFWLCAIW